MSTNVLENTLSDFERSLLVQREQAIEKAFLVQGESLKAILEGKLWRGDYDSFDHYCLTRWKIKSKYAYRLIRAYDIYASTNCRLSRESHYQALDQASPLGLEITASLLKTLEGSKVTAKDIQGLTVMVEAAIITGAIEISEGRQIPLNQLAGLEASALTELIEKKRRQWEHMNRKNKPIETFKGMRMAILGFNIPKALDLPSDQVIDTLEVYKNPKGFTLKGTLK